MSCLPIPFPTPPLGGIPHAAAHAEVLVESHRVHVTCSDERSQRLETLALHDRVGQL